WDAQASNMVIRVRDSQLQAERDRAAKAQADARAAQAQTTTQVNALVNQATTALGNRQYDAAIKLYDDALRLDPANVAAMQGRTGAVTARTLSEAANSGGAVRPAGRVFASGKTLGQSVETRTGAGPEGFDNSDKTVVAKKGSQAAELPGKIIFDVDPETVKPGENYTVKVYLLNEGNAPIQVSQMMVTPRINGKGVTAPVPPQVKEVAPRQKAMLMSSRDIWKEDTTQWSMEV